MRRTPRALRVELESLETRRLLSTTYYVDPTGSDANNGDTTHPFKTIQQAVTASNPGDTVDVRPGNYAGFILGWNGDDSGTAAAPVTFHAEPGAIVTSRNQYTADGIDIEGSDYVIIDGFTVNSTSGSITRAGIRAVIDTNVVIRNNTVNGCGYWGIFTGFSENVHIINNVASNSISQHGIYVSNSADNPVIKGNTVFGNHMCGIQINADGSEGGDGIITNALIEDNIVHDNGVGGGSGINLDGVQDSLIENNLLYNNHASGISLYQIDGNDSSRNNIIVNNTIVMPSVSRWAINIQNASTGNTVYNNILYDANTDHGAIDISSDSLSGFTSDYNVVDGRFTTDDGNSVLSLAGWQSSTGQDAHSIVSNPGAIFANADAIDFQLSKGSPANGAGTATDAPADDLVGNARQQGAGIDVGAYQSNDSQQTTPSPVSLFSNTSLPTVAADSDTRKSEIGVRFTSTSSGVITALRFYKSTGNTGMHNGHLWSSDGTLLGRAKFTRETASGWQEATFATPIRIAAGQVYVASYRSLRGHYADDANYFDTTGVTSGPLEVAAEGVDGASSVFSHGKVTRFPSRDGQGANYWVDVVYTPSVSSASASRAPAVFGSQVLSGMGSDQLIEPAVDNDLLADNNGLLTV